MSGRQELLENVVNQSIWAAEAPVETARRSLTVGLVLGIDVSTTATKAVLVDETGAVRGVGTAEYGFSVPRPLWSEQDPALWWDGRRRRDRVGPGGRPASPARTSRRSG